MTNTNRLTNSSIERLLEHYPTLKGVDLSLPILQEDFGQIMRRAIEREESTSITQRADTLADVLAVAEEMNINEESLARAVNDYLKNRGAKLYDPINEKAE